jgi:hypothetical protein
VALGRVPFGRDVSGLASIRVKRNVTVAAAAPDRLAPPGRLPVWELLVSPSGGTGSRSRTPIPHGGEDQGTAHGASFPAEGPRRCRGWRARPGRSPGSGIVLLAAPSHPHLGSGVRGFRSPTQLRGSAGLPVPASLLPADRRTRTVSTTRAPYTARCVGMSRGHVARGVTSRIVTSRGEAPSWSLARSATADRAVPRGPPMTGPDTRDRLR